MLYSEMLEAAQAMSGLLLKLYSFEAKKHGEQRGHVKKHSSCQVEPPHKTGSETERKRPFGVRPARGK